MSKRNKQVSNTYDSRRISQQVMNQMVQVNLLLYALRNEKIKECVMELFKNRDGLCLGICNGFQALIKLGLVPYGEISRYK